MPSKKSLGSEPPGPAPCGCCPGGGCGFDGRDGSKFGSEAWSMFPERDGFDAMKSRGR